MRKVFNYDNFDESTVVDKSKLQQYENTISACGCLFYRINDKTSDIEMLLIKYNDPTWPRLDDLGGQIDASDTSVFGAMSRETLEETNNQIDIKEFLNKDKAHFLYNKKSKYYFALIKVDMNFYPDTTIFGDTEFTDNIKRTIGWYKYKDIKQQLAFRLYYCTELHKYFQS